MKQRKNDMQKNSAGWKRMKTPLSKIKPFSFDIETAKEIVGDERVRDIESKARSDAEKGEPKPPNPFVGGSYWNQVSAGMDVIVYYAAFDKRIERIKRMKAM